MLVFVLNLIFICLQVRSSDSSSEEALRNCHGFITTYEFNGQKGVGSKNKRKFRVEEGSGPCEKRQICCSVDNCKR